MSQVITTATPTQEINATLSLQLSPKPASTTVKLSMRELAFMTSNDITVGINDKLIPIFDQQYREKYRRMGESVHYLIYNTDQEIDEMDTPSSIGLKDGDKILVYGFRYAEGA